ncbi:MAG: DUF559 domain-containing protein [Candidatus Marinimicrobia bacterium]|nr:DUF559 domain-containing protein [Candidatus Neomarinimicrobiota bacterium]
MNLSIVNPRKALNKAFLKVKPYRADFENFRRNLTSLLNAVQENESEEYHKNLASDFLKRTYYHPDYFINIKGNTDLVIHAGNTAASNVAVLIEAKKPGNNPDMLRKDRINVKAFHELLLYYLRERISHTNLKLKYLIATNLYEWFIFDAKLFEKIFSENKPFVDQFKDFETGKLSGITTEFFYRQIAQPYVENIKSEIPFIWFDLRDYRKYLLSNDPNDEKKLIPIFKFFAPEHLLNLSFTNDSNTLDKSFYTELLHLIGLIEKKEGSKKIITRKPAGERNSGSLIENTITQLDSHDVLHKLEKPERSGEIREEQLFDFALELVITWINRILFLKLLEAQLINYHKGSMDFSFLNIQKIKSYDDLDSLFFRVLAKKPSERDAEINAAFSNVPYLNSSLFEASDLEHNTIYIGNLQDDKPLPVLSSTVLKDSAGKKRKGELNALEYIFEFLDAYDFSGDTSETIQEEKKTLINSSVLGLIFEKINGYKDGSFFTPGFITMYMCRETIRRAIVQKFNERKGWNCKIFEELYDLIDNKQEANDIINSLKICDPAVGSGHFLVSALNEIIAIKRELNILRDRDGKTLRDYSIEVENDELIITDDDGHLFEYHPNNKESQRVQETLFHEKETIIENCLFGVDINPNSVKICRLRLWIELLKNAYYKTSSSPDKGRWHAVPELAINNSSPVMGRWPQAGGAESQDPNKSSYEVQEQNINNSSPDKGRWHAVPELATNNSSPGKGRWPQAGGVLMNHPDLKTFRRQLRKNLTPAEATLWKMLQGKHLDGRKFRRQHSIGPYIVDFYCPAERLAIELDGEPHFNDISDEYDRERTLFMNAFGVNVLRFENKVVFDDPELLLITIQQQFGKVIKPPRSATTPPYQGGELRELETLPNIDINIKCGNSLISRYSLDVDIKQALSNSKWTIESYKLAVMSYRNAGDKEQKHTLLKLIDDIKRDFEIEVSANDKRVIRKERLEGELFNLTKQVRLFEQTKKEKAEWDKKVKKLTNEIQKLENELEEIKNNKIYDNAFEWRFEIPEVLNDDGEFIGFDVVIGNPPYKMIQPHNTQKNELDTIKSLFEFADFKIDLFHLFFQKGIEIINEGKLLSFIAPSSLLNNVFAERLRIWLDAKCLINKIVVSIEKIFDDADVHNALYFFKKRKGNVDIENIIHTTTDIKAVIEERIKYQEVPQTAFSNFSGHV